MDILFNPPVQSHLRSSVENGLGYCVPFCSACINKQQHAGSDDCPAGCWVTSALHANGPVWPKPTKAYSSARCFPRTLHAVFASSGASRQRARCFSVHSRHLRTVNRSVLKRNRNCDAYPNLDVIQCTSDMSGPCSALSQRLPWHTKQDAAGSYSLRMAVMVPGSQPIPPKKCDTGP